MRSEGGASKRGGAGSAAAGRVVVVVVVLVAAFIVAPDAPADGRRDAAGGCEQEYNVRPAQQPRAAAATSQSLLIVTASRTFRIRYPRSSAPACRISALRNHRAASANEEASAQAGLSVV